MEARIYQPAKNAMQSGRSKQTWVLEYMAVESKKVDPLMGWTSSVDTQSQVTLRFENKEAAIQYAKQKALAYEVIEPKTRKANIRAGGYGENFATTRRGAWTH